MAGYPLSILNGTDLFTDVFFDSGENIVTGDMEIAAIRSDFIKLLLVSVSAHTDCDKFKTVVTESFKSISFGNWGAAVSTVSEKNDKGRVVVTCFVGKVTVLEIVFDAGKSISNVGAWALSERIFLNIFDDVIVIRAEVKVETVDIREGGKSDSSFLIIFIDIKIVDEIGDPSKILGKVGRTNRSRFIDNEDNIGFHVLAIKSDLRTRSRALSAVLGDRRVDTAVGVGVVVDTKPFVTTVGTVVTAVHSTTVSSDWESGTFFKVTTAHLVVVGVILTAVRTSFAEFALVIDNEETVGGGPGPNSMSRFAPECFVFVEGI